MRIFKPSYKIQDSTNGNFKTNMQTCKTCPTIITYKQLNLQILISTNYIYIYKKT